MTVWGSLPAPSFLLKKGIIFQHCRHVYKLRRSFFYSSDYTNKKYTNNFQISIEKRTKVLYYVL